MKTLVFATSFKRAYKRLVRRQPDLDEKVEERLALLAANPFDPVLQTHKLKENWLTRGHVRWSMTVVLCLTSLRILRREKQRFC